MATIMEDALWTVDTAVAERMVETGLIQECTRDHTSVMPIDLPIYHIACDAPKWFGFSTMHAAIIAAQIYVEDHPQEVEDEPSDLPTT